MTKHIKPKHPLHQRLNALAGTWEILASKGKQPLGKWRTTFEWLEKGAFLIQHIKDGSLPPGASPEWMENSPNPVTTVIGLDDSSGNFTLLYADARDVYRVYQMTLQDGIWELWRNAPGFSQRFRGTFNEDGDTIKGHWESSKDGETWEHDFDLAYTRNGTGF